MNNSIVPKYFRTDSSIKTLDITAKEWFDKAYGNSYHSVQVVVNYKMKNEFSFSIPLTYGYGDHYEQSTWEALIKLKVFSSKGAYFDKRRSNKITFNSSIETDHLKRDVKNFGLELNQL